MIVAKFGGTSVSSKERVLTLSDIVESELKRQPIVVVSALSGVTDLLLSLAILPKHKVKKRIKEIQQLHKNLISFLLSDEKLQRENLEYINARLDEAAKLIAGKKLKKGSLSRLVSFGEIMSSYIITSALKERGIKATQVIATKLIITDGNLGSADILPILTKRNIKKALVPLIKKGIVPVVTGFISSDQNGNPTTLGRGGSDYTASIIGFCLGAEEIQIWTDVDGMFTADPKLIKNAKLLPVVSYKEASELATFGARVLHPRTIRPAIKSGIPVRVLNTFNTKSKGSLIINEHNIRGVVRAISFKRKITLVNIVSSKMLFQKGFLARVFEVFASFGISVDLVSVSEISVSVTLDNTEGLKNAVKELGKFCHISVVENLGHISLVGEGVTSSSQTFRKIFDILDKEKILTKMVSLGATNINISLVVESEQVERTVKALHNRLLLRQINHKLPSSDKISLKLK